MAGLVFSQSTWRSSQLVAGLGILKYHLLLCLGQENQMLWFSLASKSRGKFSTVLDAPKADIPMLVNFQAQVVGIGFRIKSRLDSHQLRHLQCVIDDRIFDETESILEQALFVERQDLGSRDAHAAESFIRVFGIV
jgi:hypothetical protein